MSWETSGAIAVASGSDKVDAYSNGLESPTIEGDSPVRKRQRSSDVLPSTAGHVEPGANLGGPPPKAKYFYATDSEIVERLKGEKHPC